VENYSCTLKGHSDGIYSTAITPDGQTLATGRDKTIKLWNLRTGELIRTLSGIQPKFSASLLALMVKP